MRWHNDFIAEVTEAKRNITLILSRGSTTAKGEERPINSIPLTYPCTVLGMSMTRTARVHSALRIYTTIHFSKLNTSSTAISQDATNDVQSCNFVQQYRRTYTGRPVGFT